MFDSSRWPRRIFSGAAKLLGAGVVAGAAATLFGAVSARQFGLRYETLPMLPPGHTPVRILQIGDMHLVHGDRTKIEFVRSLAGTRPDLVVNIGDNPGGITAVPDVHEALEPLLEFPGVFVTGSNDFYGPRPANPLRYLRAPSTVAESDRLLDSIDTAGMLKMFTAKGWRPVGNQTVTLDLSDALTLDVAGTHDAHLQADRWPGFANPTTTATVLRLAVTHAPYRRVLDAAIADGADLVLAGHTHGGQVALPGYGAIVANCDLPTGFAAGLTPWRAAGRTGLVNVTAGIGVSPTVPLRTFCPPEATVIDLLPADASGTSDRVTERPDR